MGTKYFTISFDDGIEQDRMIIYLMEKYGIRGTFNISSGLFGEKTYIKRIGDLGYTTVSERKPGSRLYTPHFILSEKEALSLYSGPNVEVASHGTHHINQTKITAEQAEEEITEDFRRLSEMFGYRIAGHAFPYGSYNSAVLEALKKNGAYYARKVSMSNKRTDFSFDRKELLLPPTCWHLDSFAEQLLQRFIDEPAGDEDRVFYMWGHGYELDFGTRRGNWAHLERLFKMVSEADDICCVTNRELYEGKAGSGAVFQDVRSTQEAQVKPETCDMKETCEAQETCDVQESCAEQGAGECKETAAPKGNDRKIRIWGDQIPYNEPSVFKKDRMLIRRIPKTAAILPWLKDVFGKKLAKDAGGLDTYTYYDEIASGKVSARMDDVPFLTPYLSEGSREAVIVVPGGAFCNQSREFEGKDIAEYLNTKGISAFVLEYRENPYEAPACYLDLQRAIRYLRHHAAEYGIDPDRIGTLGFSAGGYIVGAAEMLLGDAPVDFPGYEPDAADAVSGRADTVALLYPVTHFEDNPNMLAMLAGDDAFDPAKRPALEKQYSLIEHLDAARAPQFLCFGLKDPLKGNEKYASTLEAAGIPHKTLMIEGAGHGFSLQMKKYAWWIDEYVKWLLETYADRAK